MLKLFAIAEPVELRPGTGWKHPYEVSSSLSGTFPSNWDSLEIRGYLCNSADLTTVLKSVVVAKGAAGAFIASLSAADVGSLPAGATDAVIVFLYKISGDSNAYPLAEQPVSIAGGLPSW